MYKLLLSLLIIVGSVGSTFAQDDLEVDDSFFGSVIRSRGWSWPYTAIQFNSPSEIIINSTSQQWVPGVGSNPGSNIDVTSSDTSTQQLDGFTILGFHYGMRKNLLEMGTNSSLSFGVYPALKLTALWNKQMFSLGDFGMPILFEFNYGNVSGWESDMNKGFVFGAGLDIKYSGIFQFVEEGAEQVKGQYDKFYMSTMLKLGYRYWGNNNNAKEFSIKAGWGLTSSENGPLEDTVDPATGLTVQTPSSLRAFSVELVWSTFLNY